MKHLSYTLLKLILLWNKIVKTTIFVYVFVLFEVVFVFKLLSFYFNLHSFKILVVSFKLFVDFHKLYSVNSEVFYVYVAKTLSQLKVK